MNNQIKQATPIPLLTEKGYLTNPSYATSDLYAYNRQCVAAKGRIKEWEFYQLNSKAYVLQLTYGHVTYAGNVAVNLINLASGVRYSWSYFDLFPKGSFNLNFTTGQNHEVSYQRDGATLRFCNDGLTRTLSFVNPKENTSINLTLGNDGDAMCYCIPFGGKRFYYNYKKLFSYVSGNITVKGEVYPLDSAYCLIDSGRGVWPYAHQWLWGMAQGNTGGVKVGFDLGYSNVDKGLTNENTLFVNGVQHKLGKIKITHQKNHLTPWNFADEQGRLRLTLTPLYDNFTETNYVVVHNKCHQVFGHYNGFIVDEVGNKYEINDFFGFCEHATNRW